jgi:16S rRNA processing protein RimM
VFKENHFGDSGLKGLVIIGEVVRPFGNKGEVKVALLTDLPERFKSLESVLIVKKGNPPFPKKIEGARYIDSKWAILKLKDFSFDDAQNIVGAKICIPKDKRPKLEGGRFWIDEIIGLEVYTTEGRFLGKIVNVFQTGANDVYVIEGDILIPATKEVVKNVDLGEKKMIIQLIEGLI